MAKSFRIGVDIGGTFTDIVFLSHDGQVHTRKVPSTVDDYGRGIVEGLRGYFRIQESPQATSMRFCTELPLRPTPSWRWQARRPG